MDEEQEGHTDGHTNGSETAAPTELCGMPMESEGRV